MADDTRIERLARRLLELEAEKRAVLSELGRLSGEAVGPAVAPAVPRAGSMLQRIRKCLREAEGRPVPVAEIKASVGGVPVDKEKSFYSSLAKLVNAREIIRPERGKYAWPPSAPAPAPTEAEGSAEGSGSGPADEPEPNGG